jgi:hypothetical protein
MMMVSLGNELLMSPAYLEGDILLQFLHATPSGGLLRPIRFLSLAQLNPAPSETSA